MSSSKGVFVLIHPDDNILVCCRPTLAGEKIEIDGNVHVLTQAIQVGHKIARRPLVAGEQVVKYGLPIGSMIVSANLAEHVHGHNLKSDYLPSHTRESAGGDGVQS